ncbi:MAG TPA: NAD-dependent epimerase/dehydratase family protein [Asticcacaulis sp.]|nr:NAD-dependent epimerase/dehydratase family protein [Asticcacaulis sp.]
MRYFITGTAGFIGFHLARRLLADGHVVHGYDGMTRYYDLSLKDSRLVILRQFDNYVHATAMLEDYDALHAAAEAAQADVIIHLAAQAGVRYSLENPRAYVDSNLVGSFNILEIARLFPPKHLLLASTSSVYGANDKIPFEESDMTDAPMTLYAATKKSMEVMAHSYSHLWNLPTTAFRFFTVYGPYGRPDMAPFKFVDAAHNGRAIDVYGHGQQARDFTYIDDLVEAIVRLVPAPPVRGEPVGPEDTVSSLAPHRIVNIGGGQPVELMTFIDTVEQVTGLTFVKNMLPMQKGDVPRTWASPALLERLTGFVPATPVDAGMRALVEWYRNRG